MKYQLTLLAATLALTGCGGSDSSDTSIPNYTVSGSIISPNIAPESKVCVDMNQNLQCNANEPSSIADAEGKFTITATHKNIVALPLLAEIRNSLPTDSNNTTSQYAYIAAPGLQKATGNKINGITSLLVGHMATGMTVKEASTELASQLSAQGITLPSDLLDNLNHSELMILEKNAITVLQGTEQQNRTSLFTLLSANISNHQKELVTHLLSNTEAATLITELNQITKSGGRLNDTGSVLYFTDEDNTKNVTTSPPSFPGQDAAFGLDQTENDPKQGNSFILTKIDSKGNKVSDTATEWNCVLDERSGLVWEVKSSEQSSIQYKDRMFALELDNFTPFSTDVDLATCNTEGDSICSTKDYVEHINSIKLCGKSDWRLPRFHELYNLIDFGETKTNEGNKPYGLSANYFPNQPKGHPEIEEGNVWIQTTNYNIFSPYIYPGSVYINTINLLGHNRGSVGNVEVYSNLAPSDIGESYIYPTRLVSAQGN